MKKTSNYTVYKHTFPNGKVYIGMTCQTNLNRRWGNGNGYKTQVLMARAIEKYGWENVAHEVLANGLTKEEAERAEIEAITLYKSNEVEFGYNVENGGNCTGSHSEETRKKISEAQLGEKNHMFGKPAWNRGRKQTAEERERNRISHLGQPSIWKGKHLPEEVKQKMRKPRTEEQKRKMSEAKSVPVVCVETGVIYPSGKVAAEMVGIHRGSIANATRGKAKTAGGLHWEIA